MHKATFIVLRHDHDHDHPCHSSNSEERVRVFCISTSFQVLSFKTFLFFSIFLRLFSMKKIVFYGHLKAGQHPISGLLREGVTNFWHFSVYPSTAFSKNKLEQIKFKFLQWQPCHSSAEGYGFYVIIIDLDGVTKSRVFRTFLFGKIVSLFFFCFFVC